MKITITPVTSWERVVDAARYTAKMPSLHKEPSEKWIRKMLIAEHSPIRLKEYDITIEGLPYWVMVHLVRHKVGVEFFVQSSRDDRNDNAISRAEMPQGALINMRMSINAQALITMAQMRLCSKASYETRKVLEAIRSEMEIVDPIMASVMVRRCVRLGFCPELHCCGYVRDEAITKYRNGL